MSADVPGGVLPQGDGLWLYFLSVIMQQDVHLHRRDDLNRADPLRERVLGSAERHAGLHLQRLLLLQLPLLAV